jgi:hypothetical protein
MSRAEQQTNLYEYRPLIGLAFLLICLYAHFPSPDFPLLSWDGDRLPVTFQIWLPAHISGFFLLGDIAPNETPVGTRIHLNQGHSVGSYTRGQASLVWS